eukprot:205169-Rhodomonas_salina.1
MRECCPHMRVSGALKRAYSGRIADGAGVRASCAPLRAQRAGSLRYRLRPCYAMSGTEITHGVIGLRA